MPDCELCGKNTEELHLILLEGAKMQVCAKCSKTGKYIGLIREQPVKREIIIENEAPETEIIDNYDEVIRKKREEMGMQQEEFAQKISESLSLVKKIENGKIMPSEKTTTKIERLLGIKLYHVLKRQSIEQKKQKVELTLGDIVKIKKKG